MKICIECNCGNRMSVEIIDRKYFQLNDNLENNSFKLMDFELNNGKPKEVKIYCKKCNKYVSFGLD